MLSHSYHGFMHLILVFILSGENWKVEVEFIFRTKDDSKCMLCSHPVGSMDDAHFLSTYVVFIFSLYYLGINYSGCNL